MTDRPDGDVADESAWEPKQPVVPTTWLLADFSDALSPVSVNQRKVPAKSYKLNGALPIVDQGQAFIGGYTDDHSLAVDPGEGLIVFGDHTRIFKRITFPFAAGADGIKVLRPLLCDSAYAYYACRSLQFPNRGYSRHYSFLTRCKLPIAPEAEQQRIVSKIDELFSRIDEGERALERVQKLVGRYRQSVLKAAVTGELTRDWREKNKDKLESGEALLARILKARREAWEKAELEKMKAKGITPANDKWKQKYQEPAIADTTGLPKLPAGWVWASAEAICVSVHSGTTPERHLLQANSSSGVPFIKVYNLTFDGALDFSVDPTYVDAHYHGKHMRRSRTLPGDVLTNIVGPPLGKVSVIPPTFPEWNINQAVVGFRPLSGYRNDVLSVYLQSEVAKSWLRSTTKTTTSQVNLAVTTCRRLPVPVPSEIEQAQIAETVLKAFSYADDMMANSRWCSSRATALRQSTLRAAFNGCLLPQSPSDEPAQALLARIAAERSEAPAKPKRGRKTKNQEHA